MKEIVDKESSELILGYFYWNVEERFLDWMFRRKQKAKQIEDKTSDKKNYLIFGRLKYQ